MFAVLSINSGLETYSDVARSSRELEKISVLSHCYFENSVSGICMSASESSC